MVMTASDYHRSACVECSSVREQDVTVSVHMYMSLLYQVHVGVCVHVYMSTKCTIPQMQIVFK